jgi:hypothetical protein
MSLFEAIGSLVGMVASGGNPVGAALGSSLGNILSGGNLKSALNSGIGSLLSAGTGGKVGLGLDVLSRLGGGDSVGQRTGQGVMDMLSGKAQPGARAGAGAGAAAGGTPFGGVTQGVSGLMNIMGVQNDPILAAALQYAINKPKPAMSALESRQYATGERLPDYRGTAAPGTPRVSYMAQGGYVEGPGTGKSDSIPAAIYQNGGRVQEARLSDGEFVMTENAVRGMGDGDRNLGAARMYRVMSQLEGRRNG